MSKEAALFLSDLLTTNTTLTKVNLELNSQVPSTAITDIVKACRRNRETLKQDQLPKAQLELDRLRDITGNGETCTYEKRSAFLREIAQIQRERKGTMAQVHEQEAMLQGLREERAELQQEIKR